MKVVSELNRKVHGHSVYKMMMAQLQIIFFQLVSDESNFGKFRFVDMNLENHVKLDSIALKALNLVPGNNESKFNCCIFASLERGMTSNSLFIHSQPISKRFRPPQQLPHASRTTIAAPVDKAASDRYSENR